MIFINPLSLATDYSFNPSTLKNFFVIFRIICSFSVIFISINLSKVVIAIIKSKFNLLSINFYLIITIKIRVIWFILLMYLKDRIFFHLFHKLLLFILFLIQLFSSLFYYLKIFLNNLFNIWAFLSSFFSIFFSQNIFI